MVGRFLFNVAAFFAALTQAQTCYHPDRTVASNAVPCSASNATFCCGSNAICLSNGYCLSATTQPYVLYRGSCTDSGWGSFCAYYCVNYRTGDDAPITSVGLNSNGRAIYCCGYQTDNHNTTTCSNGDAPFQLEDGHMVFGRAALADASLTNSSSSNLTTTTGGGDTSGSAEPAPGQCSSNSIAIGAGVGVPLGLLALSAVAWALWERKRRAPMVTSCREEIRATKGAEGVEGTPGKHIYRKAGPTELQETSPTLLHNQGILEMMGSEGRRE